MLKLTSQLQMDHDNIYRYDEFNIYQEKPTKDELKKFMTENNLNRTGEELAYFTIEKYDLDESYFNTLNEILDDLGL